MSKTIFINDLKGELHPLPKGRVPEEERPNRSGSNLKPRHAGGHTVVSEEYQAFGEPTLIADPRFPDVTATLSRYEPENEDALTVTLRNTGAAAVEGYRVSLLPPAGREFGGNIGVTGSHPYDWTETSTAPNDSGWHITVDRLVPGMRATLDFELVPNMLRVTDPLVAEWMQTIIIAVPGAMDTRDGWRRMAASNPAVALALRVGAITVLGCDDSKHLLDFLGETEAQAEAAVMSHAHYGQVFRQRVRDVPALRDLMEAETHASTARA